MQSGFKDMASSTYSTLHPAKSRMQHYILNWIVISRYRMVHCGIPKKTTVRCLLLVENFLKKINLIAS